MEMYADMKFKDIPKDGTFKRGNTMYRKDGERAYDIYVGMYTSFKPDDIVKYVVGSGK